MDLSVNSRGNSVSYLGAKKDKLADSGLNTFAPCPTPIIRAPRPSFQGESKSCQPLGGPAGPKSQPDMFINSKKPDKPANNPPSFSAKINAFINKFTNL